MSMEAIPGLVIDPEPKDPDALVRKVADKGAAPRLGIRVFLRFGAAKASLLAAGTAYYVFLAMFAVIALAFGVLALVGADQFSASLTEELSNAFPGLVGDDGIDADQLRSIGQASSLVGLLLMLYSSTGAMAAVSSSLHQIYGAPNDPRNFVVAKLRLALWVVIIAPLILVSLMLATAVSGVVQQLPFLDDSVPAQVVVTLSSLLISLLVDTFIVYLMLGHLGGIRPERGPRFAGAILGGVGISALKYLLAFIVGWSVSKPEYGAFAAPIAVLLLLYLQVLVLYLSAATAAGVATDSAVDNAAPESSPPEDSESAHREQQRPERDRQTDVIEQND
ncbi:MAG: YihY/virulence factor BrkB family protein [Actinomycetia bacterium]|nr:YihY/virulence factor BrkB family protein [Actinomycetes bacterium]